MSARFRLEDDTVRDLHDLLFVVKSCAVWIVVCVVLWVVFLFGVLKPITMLADWIVGK